MLIKFGSIVVNGRGKLGGHVYSKNRGGAYVRTLQTPTNPQTRFQQEGRQVFTELTQAWSSLTLHQRDGWNAATDNFTRTDVFGDTRKLSGKGLYISLNKELNLIGKPRIDDAPNPADIVVPSFLGAIWDTNIGTLEIQSDVFGLLTDPDQVVLRATPPVTAGTTFVKNKLVVIATGTEVSDQTLLYNRYVDRFGAPALNDTIFFGIYTINDVGERSPDLNTRSVVINP